MITVMISAALNQQRSLRRVIRKQRIVSLSNHSEYIFILVHSVAIRQARIVWYELNLYEISFERRRKCNQEILREQKVLFFLEERMGK